MAQKPENIFIFEPFDNKILCGGFNVCGGG